MAAAASSFWPSRQSAVDNNTIDHEEALAQKSGLIHNTTTTTTTRQAHAHGDHHQTGNIVAMENSALHCNVVQAAAAIAAAAPCSSASRKRGRLSSSNNSHHTTATIRKAHHHHHHHHHQAAKRLPQRGMGVAQLEKLRIAEEQQRAAQAAASYHNNININPVPPLIASSAASSSSPHTSPLSASSSSSSSSSSSCNSASNSSSSCCTWACRTSSPPFICHPHACSSSHSWSVPSPPHIFTDHRRTKILHHDHHGSTNKQSTPTSKSTSLPPLSSLSLPLISSCSNYNPAVADNSCSSHPPLINPASHYNARPPSHPLVISQLCNQSSATLQRNTLFPLSAQDGRLFNAQDTLKPAASLINRSCNVSEAAHLSRTVPLGFDQRQLIVPNAGQPKIRTLQWDLAADAAAAAARTNTTASRHVELSSFQNPQSNSCSTPLNQALHQLLVSDQGWNQTTLYSKSHADEYRDSEISNALLNYCKPTTASNSRAPAGLERHLQNHRHIQARQEGQVITADNSNSTDRKMRISWPLVSPSIANDSLVSLSLGLSPTTICANKSPSDSQVPCTDANHRCAENHKDGQLEHEEEEVTREDDYDDRDDHKKLVLSLSLSSKYAEELQSSSISAHESALPSIDLALRL